MSKQPAHNFESFQSSRWIWRINFVLQILLLLVLLAGLNYLGMRFFIRADLTRNRAYSLSAETLSYIHNLKEPVKVVVTVTDDSDNSDELTQAYGDIHSMLREFSYAARNNPDGKIDVEYLNVYQQRKEAENLKIEQPNAVVFIAGDKRKTIFLPDLYKTRNRQRRQFQGEKVFTAALLDVSSRKQPVLYFLTGHGEMKLNDVDPLRGISQLDGALRVRNYKVETLDLNVTHKVPADASMVLDISPQTPLFPQEQEILRQYLDDAAGRLLVVVDPGHKHGLDDLFYEWGIRTDDVKVVEADPSYLIGGGDILVKRFMPHPITQVLIDNNIGIVCGLARSVRADPGRPIDPSLTVTDLMETSVNNSWGERDYRQRGPAKFDPNVDLRGPIKLGAVAERKVDSRLGVSIPGGRLIVLGTSDLISNNLINVAGNLTFFLNAINWALDRNSALHIPARPVERIQLNLSQDQLTYSRLGIMVGPPLLIALFGGLVFLLRRRNS